MFKLGMAWSHGVKGFKELCLVFSFIYIFIYYLFISAIHCPFYMRSEDDLYVTGQ